MNVFENRNTLPRVITYAGLLGSALLLKSAADSETVVANVQYFVGSVASYVLGGMAYLVSLRSDK